jgi:hypothetical protein
MEKWKKIKGYENYSVSNLGRVKNNKPNRQTKKRGGVLMLSKNDAGYFCVGLHKDKEVKTFRVSR